MCIFWLSFCSSLKDRQLLKFLIRFSYGVPRQMQLVQVCGRCESWVIQIGLHLLATLSICLLLGHGYHYWVLLAYMRLLVACWSQWSFQIIFQVPIPKQLISRGQDYIFYRVFIEPVQFLKLFISLHNVHDIRLGYASCYLTMFLGLLSQHLPLDWVAGSLHVCLWLFCEHILDW